ncbi:unnamed protein product [Polarella glacialis]|uniref:Uncharacterized protein n=1 Tax=Polarella glacialis TaxID=89957 RepID=A0A813FE16_POLGL|nr:unnamed protein product [Polarella glacialis]CAE8681499.1 unnamed protein product [Polarella glacialis]
MSVYLEAKADYEQEHREWRRRSEALIAEAETAAAALLEPHAPERPPKPAPTEQPQLAFPSVLLGLLYMNMYGFSTKEQSTIIRTLNGSCRLADIERRLRSSERPYAPRRAMYTQDEPETEETDAWLAEDKPDAEQVWDYTEDWDSEQADWPDDDGEEECEEDDEANEAMITFAQARKNLRETVKRRGFVPSDMPLDVGPRPPSHKGKGKGKGRVKGKGKGKFADKFGDRFAGRSSRPTGKGSTSTSSRPTISSSTCRPWFKRAPGAPTQPEGGFFSEEVLEEEGDSANFAFAFLTAPDNSSESENESDHNNPAPGELQQRRELGEAFWAMWQQQIALHEILRADPAWEATTTTPDSDMPALIDSDYETDVGTDDEDDFSSQDSVSFGASSHTRTWRGFSDEKDSSDDDCQIPDGR